MINFKPSVTGLVALGTIAITVSGTVLPSVAIPLAQTPAPSESPSVIPQDSSAPPPDSKDSLPPFPTIQPRIFGQFTTGPGLGYESSFGSVYGFVPFAQTPGISLGYAEARLNLTTSGANLGGNLLLGYRHYLQDSNLILGGYVGYDIRDTGLSTFSQVGAGVEVLGRNWEGRLNGYIPVGNTRNMTSEVSSSLGSSLSNLNFQQNLLFATLQQTTQVDRSFESALGGMDVEVGTKLVGWRNGNLRGYVGGYVYGGEGTNTFAGFRSRLALQQGNTYRGGIALTTDGEFGTQVAFSIGIGFGGVKGKPKDLVQESRIARLGGAVDRQSNIVVQDQFDRQIVQTPMGDYVVNNPATGQPWYFVHVTPGVTGGTGTVESPLSTTTTAFAATQGDGNSIVYLQSGNNSGLSGFTIPAQVQVLSTGPQQFIPASVEGQLFTPQLPGSGTGNLPLVTGTVTMSSYTTLNGFSISPEVNQPGVLGVDVSNVTVANNRIQTTGDQAYGIAFLNSTPNASQTNSLTIANNTVSTSGAAAFGIVVGVTDGAGIGTVQVSNNTISTTGRDADGIFLFADTQGSIGSAQVSSNLVSTIGTEAEGINIQTGPEAKISTVQVKNNSVSTTGFEADGIFLSTFVFTRNNKGGDFDAIQITGNTVATTGNDADGIYIFANAGAIIDRVLIDSNIVSTIGNDQAILIRSADAIKVLAFDESQILNLTITNNTITSAEGNGIIVQTIPESGPGQGQYILTKQNAGTICVSLSGNNSQNPGTTGLTSGTNYSFVNATSSGSLSIVGSDLNSVTSTNSPSDPAAYSTTGNITYVSSCP
jgi:trimeric autotransporter adhesin